MKWKSKSRWYVASRVYSYILTLYICCIDHQFRIERKFDLLNIHARPGTDTFSVLSCSCVIYNTHSCVSFLASNIVCIYIDQNTMNSCARI